MTHKQAEKLAREKGSFFSHVATLTTGTAVAQGINILAMLLLTRIFAPQAFGLLALFMTCVSLFSVLGGARYELAIMLPEHDTAAVNVFYGSVLALFLIALLGLAAIALFHARVTQLLGDPAVAPWLWSMPAVLFLMGLYQILSYWCGRMKRFQKVAISRIALTVGTVAAQVGLFLLHFSGGLSLIGGWIIGQATGTFFLVTLVARRDGRFLLRHARFSSVPGLLKTYRNFPLYKAPNSFISSGASQLVVVVIRFFSNLMTVGFFSLAFRAISLPVSLITSSMNQVFYEKAARESGNPAQLESFVNRVLYIQVVLMTPMLVLAAFEAKLLFIALFGARWAMSGQFASWLAFAGFMYFISSWLDRLFDIHSRQKLSLALRLAGNSFSLAALAATLYFTGNAVAAVAAFALSEVVYTCIWLWFAYRIAAFRGANLLRIAAAFAAAAVPVFLMIGVIHLVLAGWAAFATSFAAVLLFEAVFSLRKVGANRSLFPSHGGSHVFLGQKPSLHQRCEFARQCYLDCAAELAHLLANQKPTRALELGCCGGSVLSFLELPGCSYTAVDFNSQFLETFHSHPHAAWKTPEPSSPAAHHASCDLIFSHAAVAHFDPTMLSRHLRNAKALMHRKSVLICGSLLDRENRFEYDTAFDAGKGLAGYLRCYVRLGKSYVRRILGVTNPGHWYDRNEFSIIARLNGFEVSFVRSSACAYRFHAVLRLVQTGSKPGRPAPSIAALPLLAAKPASTRLSRFRAACRYDFRRLSA